MNSLAINFWSKCSNHCIFCFCNEADLLSEELLSPIMDSPEEVGKALMRHRKEYDWLIISGNEPTLNPDLLVMIMLAKKMGYNVELKTNGRKLKDMTFCRKLLKAGVDRISITLLSHDWRTHEFLSGASGAFFDTVAGIKNLRFLWNPKKIGIYNVVTRHNFKQLAKNVAFYHELGLRDVQFNFVYHTDGKITPSLSELEKNLQLAIRDAIKLEMKISVYGFPLCFLGKYYKLASELSTNHEDLLEGKVVDCKKIRTDFGKKKTKYCRDCRLGNICDGTWKSYYKIYGEEEFKNKKI